MRSQAAHTARAAFSSFCPLYANLFSYAPKGKKKKANVSYAPFVSYAPSVSLRRILLLVFCTLRRYVVFVGAYCSYPFLSGEGS